jgi:hypothetical protein
MISPSAFSPQADAAHEPRSKQTLFASAKSVREGAL